MVAAALVFEAVGAVTLWWAWKGDFGSVGAIWPAVFHAISAFCNAGFSIFSDSLEGYAGRPSIVGIVSVLVVLGGLGFGVRADLWTRFALAGGGEIKAPLP